MSHLARLSLVNRALVALATLGVMGFGVFAATSLNQELIPSRTLPSISVVTPYQGAPPGVVERAVTEPIESVVQGGHAHQEMTSQSKQGMSVVQVSYAFDTDTEEVAADLQRRIDGAQERLPEDVDPKVQAGSFDNLPVVLLAADASDNRQELAEQLQDEVAPKLESIDGVSGVSVTGVRDRVVRVQIKPDKLSDRGLTVQAVSNALQSNDSVAPGGGASGGGENLSIEVGNTFGSLKEIRNLPLPASAGTSAASGASGARGGAAAPPAAQERGQDGQNGQDPTRIKHVADVSMKAEEISSITRTNGKPSLGVSITKTDGGNTVDISNAVHDQLSELESSLGGNASLTVVFDQAPFIEDSIEGLTTEGLLGLGFAVVVILIFLLSIRSTVVTAVSIPLSLLMALIGLWLWGFSLNLLTLGGLTIAVGRVVDDSIVVLENIKRHLGYGEEKRQAILSGVREVAGAITSSTLATAAVFLPIAVVGGLVGQLFRPFSLAVSIALLASLLVSLTVIPVLAFWFLKPSAGARKNPERMREEELARELRTPLQRAYVPILQWATRHQVVTLGLAVLIFAGSMALVPRLQTTFLGSSGQNTFTIEQELKPGASLSATSDAARKVEKVLADTPDVETYQVTIGSTGGTAASFFGTGSSNSATYSVTADPDAERAEVEQRLRRELGDIKGAGDISLSSPQTSGSGLEVVVTASDEGTLREAAGQVREIVQDTPNTTDVTSNLNSEVPNIDVNVNQQKAASRGMTQTQIGQSVRMVTQGMPAAEATIDDERRDIVVRVDSPSAPTPKKLAKLAIPTPAGTVQLGDVANISRVQAPVQITHTGGDRSATITASASGDNLGAISSDLRERLADAQLPEGANYSLGGVTEDQQQAFRDLGIALGVAVLLVYLIMVAAFRSLLQPLLLLVSVPFAATGTVLLLVATDTALGVSALIGALMLVGIVVTNAIVLLDLINQYRAGGMDAHTAVIEGARHRLRPVLMTALATICALTPMAFGLTGDGAFISQPLAITVIGGLTTSTVLTLILVPALYALAEQLRSRHDQRGDSERSEEELLNLYRDLPDQRAREEFVHVMNGVAQELGENREQTQLPPASSSPSSSPNSSSPSNSSPSSS